MATLQMKIDNVHAEFLSGNAVSSGVNTHSVVSRDGNGDVHSNTFVSANLKLSHSAASRTTDTVFYSSNADTIYKNTAAGLKASLGLSNVTDAAATVAATPDKIVLRDSGGDIFANNVGIGTTSPGDILEIYKSGGSDNVGMIIGNGDRKWRVGIRGDTSDAFVIQDDEAGAMRMVFNSSGNIGIGTTSPVGKLDVWDGASNGSNIQQNAFFYLRNPANAATNYGAVIVFENTNGASGGRHSLGRIAALRENNAGNYSSYLQFSPTLNSTEFEAMRITSAGNVGIGTPSPDTKLTLSIGDITTSANIARFHSNYDSYNNGYLTIEEHNHTPNNNDWTGYGTRIQKMVDVTYQGYIEFNPVDGQYSTAFGNGTTEYMRIQYPTGNVGIGTASPADKLEIYKSGVSDNAGMVIKNGTRQWRVGVRGDTSSVFAIQDDTDAAIRMVIDSSGDVGIGTASPSGKLDIYTGDTSIVGLSLDRYASGNYRTDIYQNSYGPDFRVGYNTYTPQSILYLKRLSDGTKEVEINGNVGIGTASPRQKLDITNGNIAIVNTSWKTPASDDQAAGRIHFFVGGPGSTELNTPVSTIIGYDQYETNGSFEGALAFETQGVERMRIRGGNVGIGTTYPDEKLDVRNGSTSGMVSFQATAGGFTAKRWSGTYGQTTHNPEVRTDFGERRPRLMMMNSAGTQTVFISGDSADNSYINAGRVGIGTTTPKAGLHVSSKQWDALGDSNTSYSKSYTNTTYWSAHTGSASMNWGIYSEYVIGCTGGFVHSNATFSASDERIKKNIVDADDAECLETLRLLKPKKYQYRDVIGRGEEPVWGFIAQEVKETLPHTTKFIQDVIPNIYELANVSSSNVITFTDFNTANLEANATTLIKVTGIDDKNHYIHLVEVIDEHTIRVEEDLNNFTGSVDAEGNVISEITATTITPEEYEALEDTSGYVANISGYQNANVSISVEEYNALEDTTGYEQVVQDYTKTSTTYPGNQLFVHGQEVDDFVYIQKEAIWTVTTAALQEVDRQLQAEKTKTAALETQLASVLTRLNALENA